jgi:putative transposase
MRYRDYKIFRPGCYYHVYNRGNNKQDVFLGEGDYISFLRRFCLVLGLPVSAARTSIRPLPVGAFSIVSYCLMPNHFHLLIRQNTDVGVDKLLLKLCTSYAIYFNHKYDHIGNVFQDAFKAKLVENDMYAKYLSAYIHNNPADLDYDYSSYKDIMGIRDGQICDTSIVLSWFNNSPYQYRDFLRSVTKEDEHIRHQLFEGF